MKTGSSCRLAASLLLPVLLWLNGCGGGGGGSDNRRPVADAGVDQVVRAGTELILSGRDSDDPDGPVQHFRWRRVSGPEIPQENFVQETASTIRVRIPPLSERTGWVFELEVEDNAGAVATDRVRVDAVPANDPNRFLKFFEHVDRFTVVAATAEPDQIQADTVFTVSLTARIDYPPLPSAEQPEGIDLTGDGRFRREMPLGSRTGEWLQSAGATPRDCDAPNNPRLVFEVPAVDVDELPRISEGRRDEVDYRIDVSLSASGVPVATYLCVLRGVPGDGAARHTVVAEGSGAGGMSGSTLSVNLDDLIDENRQVAEAYYRAIDPDNEKLTLRDWLDANGFETVGNSLQAVVNDNVHEARYINGFDLGFGRHMFVRTDPVTGDVASYVINYPNLEALFARLDPIATVAMEYSPGPSGGEPYTKFYTYVLNRENNRHERVLGMDFDGRGEKYMPGVCAACHAGTPVSRHQLEEDAQGNPVYPNEGDIGARFFPWDVSSLYFSDDQFESRDASLPPERGLARAGQEAAFKAFNEAVLKTNATDAVIELVHGWYGGPDLPEDTFQGDFVPPGWAGEETLYREVIAPYCRACHTLQEPAVTGIPDLASHEDFEQLAGTIRTRVFDEARMPMARMTMDNFWSLGDPRPADLLAGHLGLEDGAPEPAAPTVDIRVRRGAASGPGGTLAAERGQPVMADVTGQHFGERFEWTLTRNGDPAGAPEIVGRNGQIASFTPDAPGEYTLAISVAGLGGARSEDQVSLSVPNQLPEAVDLEATARSGGTVEIDIVGQLSEPGDPPTIVDAVGMPTNGSVQVNADDTGVVYTAPVTGDSIQDSFSYTVRDADGDTGTGTVTVSVTALPSAVNDAVSLDAGSEVTVDVLANDGLGLNDSARVVSITDPGDGTAQIVNDGTDVRYEPRSFSQGFFSYQTYFVGTDSLSYTIRDDNGDESTATVTFNVEPTVTYTALYDNIFNVDCVSCHTSGDASTPFNFDSRDASVGEVQSRVSSQNPDCSLIVLKPSAQTTSPCGGSITFHTGGRRPGFDHDAGCASGDFSPEGSCRYDRVLRWIQEGGLDN